MDVQLDISSYHIHLCSDPFHYLIFELGHLSVLRPPQLGDLSVLHLPQLGDVGILRPDLASNTRDKSQHYG